MDFNALQHKLFALDPSDPAEDLRKLTESADGQAQKNVAETVNYVQESVEVQQGTMPVAGDYSLGDFAALAGVTLTEAQKKGPAGQAKGKDPIPKTSKPSRTGEQPHPLKDKLVGEDNNRIAQLEDRVAQLEAMLQEERTDEIYPAIAGIAARAAAGAVADKVVDKLTANKNPKKTPIKNRNPVASHAQSSGSGVHKDQFQKNKPDRKQKHKKDYANESIKAQLWAALKSK